MSAELLALRPYWAILAGILGAMLGSFLNVCIVRWGAEPKQSVVRPRSRCPRCGRSLAWYENIPIVSWMALRARCSGCGEPISVQYPLIELTTAAIWAYVVWRNGFSVQGLREAVFGTILLGIAMTDAREYIIPHEFSIGGTAIALLLSLWPEPANLLVVLQGALVGAGAVLLIGELSELAVGQEAMGGGDCALMGLIGAFLGWESILPVLLLGALISTIIYLISSVRRGARESPQEDTPPLGPKGFRWMLVLRLFALGAVPILLLAAAITMHVFGQVVTALFDGLIGAGIAYYASFLLPVRVEGEWLRVRGLLAAALGVAFGGGLMWPRIVAGVVLAVAVVWSVQRTHIILSPESTEDLESEGYLPFGVGLAMAAGLVLLSGTMPLVREVVLEYGRILRLA